MEPNIVVTPRVGSCRHQQYRPPDDALTAFVLLCRFQHYRAQRVPVRASQYYECIYQRALLKCCTRVVKTCRVQEVSQTQEGFTYQFTGINVVALLGYSSQGTCVVFVPAGDQHRLQTKTCILRRTRKGWSVRVSPSV